MAGGVSSEAAAGDMVELEKEKEGLHRLPCNVKEFLPPDGQTPVDFSGYREEKERKKLEATNAEEIALETGAEANVDEQDEMDEELQLLLKEIESTPPVERLEQGESWKATGNARFKEGDYEKASDGYIRAIYYLKDITGPPEFVGLEYSKEIMNKARTVIESCCTNLSLMQYKMGLVEKDPEYKKVLFRESVLSAEKCLGFNKDNKKALFRKPLARYQHALCLGDETCYQLLKTAGKELFDFIRLEPSNTEARSVYASLQEDVKKYKPKNALNFKDLRKGVGSFLSNIDKAKDILGDGSAMKSILERGKVSNWFVEDWVSGTSKTRCLVTLQYSFNSGPTKLLSFILGQNQVPTVFEESVKQMHVEEVSNVTITGSKSLMVSTDSRFRHYLPVEDFTALEESDTSTLKIAFIEWTNFKEVKDVGLCKVVTEGYGDCRPEPLSHCVAKWTCFGPDGDLLFGSDVVGTFDQETSSFKRAITKDETKNVNSFELDDDQVWQPVGRLCSVLKQGGKARLRVPCAPPITGFVDKQLSETLPKFIRDGEIFEVDVVVELKRVRPCTSLNNFTAVVQERFRAEQLFEKRKYILAARRYRRILQALKEVKDDRKEILEKEELETTAMLSQAIILCEHYDAKEDEVLQMGNNKYPFAVAAAHLAYAYMYLHDLKREMKEEEEFRMLSMAIMSIDDALKADKNYETASELKKKVKPRLDKIRHRQAVELLRETVSSLAQGKQQQPPDFDELEFLVSKLYEQIENNEFLRYEDCMEVKVGVELKDVKSLPNCPEPLGAEVMKVIESLVALSKKHRPMWD